MPRLHVERDVLSDSALAINQQMSRDSQVGYLRKVAMLVRVQMIAEQLIDVTCTVFSRRQTDVMNHQQINPGSL